MIPFGVSQGGHSVAGHRPPPSSPVVRRPAARSSATPNASSSAWFAAHRRTYRRAWGCAASPPFPPPLVGHVPRSQRVPPNRRPTEDEPHAHGHRNSDTNHIRQTGRPRQPMQRTDATPAAPTSTKLGGRSVPVHPPSIPYALYPTTLATLPPKYKGRAMPRLRPLFIQTYPICLTGRYVVYQRHPVAHPWLEYGEMRPLGPRRNATATQRLVDIVACTLPSPRIFLLL